MGVLILEKEKILKICILIIYIYKTEKSVVCEREVVKRMSVSIRVAYENENDD